mgnify:CR=1 FL=1
MTTVERRAEAKDPEPKRISLSIEGMTCAACVIHVEHALKDVKGVDVARVNLATEKRSLS